jgi:Protein of unknown function (DUF2510).
MSDTAPPPAGWYADPENPAGERWWNGSGWSDHKRAATVEPVAESPAFAPPASGAPVVSVSPVPPAPDGTASVDAGLVYGSTAARPDPYAPPPAYVAPYGAPQPGSGINGLALAGLLVAALGWIVFGALAGIAGILLSAFGLSQARKREAAGNPNSGRALAIAGLAVSIGVTVIGAIVVIAYFVFLLTIGYPS